MRMASSTNHFAGSCISQISWLCLRTRQCITTIALPLSKFLSRWSAVPVKDDPSIDLSATSLSAENGQFGANDDAALVCHDASKSSCALSCSCTAAEATATDSSQPSLSPSGVLSAQPLQPTKSVETSLPPSQSGVLFLEDFAWKSTTIASFARRPQQAAFFNSQRACMCFN
eukprot:m.395864 g.395864  ORF g.395864 m.395864 type:complete len:172 (+) comp56401_c0_seq9:743-1258(+)